VTALAQQGIKLVQGDLNHPESYTDHLKGHYAAFVNANCEPEMIDLAKGALTLMNQSSARSIRPA
jgi:hypothetical protein